MLMLFVLFIVMLSKALLTSHSRMSGSRWVITLSWLSRSLRSFLYGCVYSRHLFFIPSASVRSIPFLSFIVPIFAGNVPLVFQNEMKSTEWSRAKANRVLPREHTGHSKHPLPTTQDKTLHMDMTRWSIPKSDGEALCCCYIASVVSDSVWPHWRQPTRLPVPGILQEEHWSGLPFPSPMHESEKWKWNCSVVSNS